MLPQINTCCLKPHVQMKAPLNLFVSNAEVQQFHKELLKTQLASGKVIYTLPCSTRMGYWVAACFICLTTFPLSLPPSLPSSLPLVLFAELQSNVAGCDANSLYTDWPAGSTARYKWPFQVPAQVQVFQGACCMLRENLDVAQGHVNGAMYKVRRESGLCG